MEPKPKLWETNADFAIGHKFAKFNGAHPREYASLFANLNKIVDLLQTNKLGAFRVNFFRSEGEGVYRIGQTSVPHALESRLYLFPDTESNTMFVLTIGDKSTQDDDIKEAHSLVTKIRAKRQEK